MNHYCMDWKEYKWEYKKSISKWAYVKQFRARTSTMFKNDDGEQARDPKTWKDCFNNLRNIFFNFHTGSYKSNGTTEQFTFNPNILHQFYYYFILSSYFNNINCTSC